MIVMPSVDVLDGACVRLHQGRFDAVTQYDKSPLQWARFYAEQGFGDLHLVDLDGSRQGRPLLLALLRAIGEETGLRVQYGGGIRDRSAVDRVLQHGAQRVVLGTLAHDSAVLRACVEAHGPERIVVAADHRGDRVQVDAWRRDTGTALQPFIETTRACGVQRFLCTDIGRDGALSGPALEHYRTLKQQDSSLFLIASGGIRNRTDLDALSEAGLDAAVVGKALLGGDIDASLAAQRFGG